MNQYERMKQGLIYDPMDESTASEQEKYAMGLWEFNRLSPKQSEEKKKYMKEVFAECGEGCYIELPFHANWGGANLHLGSNVYANFNLTIVDDEDIFVGDNVMFGPNVTITTANHPIHPALRKRGLQYNRPVHIGNNVWICANAVIAPGVTIGDDSVIGAGSVVLKDVPKGVLAAGVPCRVIRELGEHDREFYFRDERIDWENL